MLTCKEVAIRASALIDRDLTVWQRLQMKLHLSMCKGCAAFVVQLRTTRDLTEQVCAAPALSGTNETHINSILSQFHGEASEKNG